MIGDAMHMAARRAGDWYRPAASGDRPAGPVPAGKDLQYIRINGTLVGGMIGVLLYVISQPPAWIGLMRAG